MFFSLARALGGAAASSGRERARRSPRCCPAPSRCCSPTPPRRFPPACGPDAGATLGLRVPGCPSASAPLGELDAAGDAVEREPLRWPDARTLEEVPASIRDGAELVLDGGELPGTPSTVIDLRGFEAALAHAARGRAPRRAIGCAHAEGR